MTLVEQTIRIEIWSLDCFTCRGILPGGVLRSAVSTITDKDYEVGAGSLSQARSYWAATL